MGSKTAKSYSPEFREQIIGVLEKIALSAEILGRNYISDDEFKMIVSDPELRTLVKYSTAFKKSEGELVTWKFEHNNIQEYLAAKNDILKSQSEKSIKFFNPK